MKWLKRITNRFKKDYVWGYNNERLVLEGNAYVGWTGQRFDIVGDELVPDDSTFTKVERVTNEITEDIFWELLGGKPDKAPPLTTIEQIKSEGNFLWELVDRLEQADIVIDNRANQVIFHIAEMRRYLSKFEVEHDLS